MIHFEKIYDACHGGSSPFGVDPNGKKCAKNKFGKAPLV
jgi:hypothetical protein